MSGGDVKAVLAWCNARRASRGKKPLKRLPQGRRHDTNACPCAKATGLMVDYVWYTDPKQGCRRWRTPRAVAGWLRSFDQGAFPQYDREAS